MNGRVRGAAAAMVVVAGAAAGGALLAGCGTLNEDMAIGDELLLPALAPQPVLREPDEGSLSPPVPPASVVSITRENWGTTEFLVPNAWVEHRAESHVDPRYTSAAVRRETFPTEQSALDDEPLGRRVLVQTLEGVVAPVFAGLDLVMTIPRAVAAHPWTVQVSPREAYERTPPRLRPVVPYGTLEDEEYGEPEPEQPPVPSELVPEMPAPPQGVTG